MRKTYVVIVVLVLVGVSAGMYLFVVKSKSNVQPLVVVDQKKSTSSVQGQIGGEQNNNVAPQNISTKDELTREELIVSEWPLEYKKILLSGDWKPVGNYDIKFDNKTFPNSIMVRKTDTQEEIAHFSLEIFVPSLPDILDAERQENISNVEIIANPTTEKLYAFITFGNSHGGGFRKVYESNLFGKNAHELVSEQGEYTYPKSYRFSPDHTQLSYVADETESKLIESTNTWEQAGNDKVYFHIIDLLKPDRFVKILLPPVKQYVDPQSDEVNWVAAWRFTEENTIEFTRYTARGNEANGYTQISNKELWIHDRITGKMTLFETVPFVQE